MPVENHVERSRLFRIAISDGADSISSFATSHLLLTLPPAKTRLVEDVSPRGFGFVCSKVCVAHDDSNCGVAQELRSPRNPAQQHRSRREPHVPHVLLEQIADHFAS